MSYITQGVAAITRNAGKIVRAIKGIKNTGPALIKGVKSSGVAIGKGLKSAGTAVSGIGQSTSQAASTAATTASTAAATIRDTIGAGVTKVKNLFPKKPAGVVRETVISKGGPAPKQILRTRVREGNFAAPGRFDESLTTGLKNIQDIPKTGIPKQVLTKTERLGAAKDAFRSTIVKEQKGMAYI
jgi:hypothetical protein